MSKLKKLIACCVIATFILPMGCTRRLTNEHDITISTNQATVTKACYDSITRVRPDMSAWSIEQVERYELIQVIKDSNSKFASLAAKEPLDPCAKAAGTNVYDAQIQADKQDTEFAGKWLGFGEKVLSTALFAYGIHEVAGMLKDMNANAGTTINGDNNSLTGVGNKGDKWSASTTNTTTTTTTDNSSHLSDSASMGDNNAGTIPPVEPTL